MGLLSRAQVSRNTQWVKLLTLSILTPSTPGTVQEGEEPGASLGHPRQNAERGLRGSSCREGRFLVRPEWGVKRTFPK